MRDRGLEELRELGILARAEQNYRLSDRINRLWQKADVKLDQAGGA